MYTGTYQLRFMTAQLLLALLWCSSVLSRPVPLQQKDSEEEPAACCGEDVSGTVSLENRSRAGSQNGLERNQGDEFDSTDTPPMLWFIMPGLMWVLACCCGIWIMRLLCRESRLLAGEIPTGTTAHAARAEAAHGADGHYKDLDCSIEASAQHPPKMLYRVDAVRWATSPPEPPQQTADDAQDPSITKEFDNTPPVDSVADESSQQSDVQDDDINQDNMTDEAQNAGLETQSGGDDAPSMQDKALSINAKTADNPTCLICMEREGDHVLLPCGHGGYCGSCAHTLLAQRASKRLCPICRAAMHAVAHVSLSTPVGAAGEVLEHSVASTQPCGTSRQSSRQNSQRNSQRRETSWSRVLVWTN